MPYTTPHSDCRAACDRRWIWAIPALILFGVVAATGLVTVASSLHTSGVEAIGLVLAAIPAAVLVVIALRHAARYAVTFFSLSIRWWHALWLLTFVSALIFRVRSASDITADPLDAWAIFRIAVDMSVAFCLLGRLALRRTHWLGSFFRGAIGALTVFGLVCVASTVWSVYPPWTFYKSIEYLVDIALIAAIVESVVSIEDFRDLFNWTWALYALALMSVWMGVLIWPHKALYGESFKMGTLGIRLQGVLPAFSANNVGTFAAVLGVLALARLLPISEERFNKPWYGLLLAVSVVTMVCSQTRTAIAGFVLGGLLVLVFTRRKSILTFLIFVGAPIAAVVTAGGIIWTYLERGQTQRQLNSLSSRATWWSFAWQTFMQHPLTGFGAYAAGRFAVMAKMGLGDTSTMHSDYLEIIVGTSFWGMIPFLAALLVPWWLLLRYVRDDFSDPQERQLAFEALAIFALLSFRSIFMTELTWHPPLHFLVILGYAEFLRRRHTARFAFHPQWQTIRAAPSRDLAADMVRNNEAAAHPGELQT